MLAYANGRYPLGLFVHRGGNIYLTPSLNARWNEMVRLADEKYGVRLYITGDIDGLGGWNGYRPWDAQGKYKRYYGSKAAAQGYSSHGGKYQGREVFALDIANLDALAPNNTSLARARLTALAKAVGLTVDFVTPTEWWHVGDFNNAWSAPRFGHLTINPNTTNRPAPLAEGEDDMPKNVMHHMLTGKTYDVLITNPGSGFKLRYSTVDPNLNSTLADQYGTGDSELVDDSMFRAIESATDAVRTGTV